jgi:exonuclease III
MRIIFWNILHGGGPARTPEIILALLEHAADVVALCEFRITRGSQIRAALADHGYIHQCTSHRPGRTNGMFLASRRPCEQVERLVSTESVDAVRSCTASLQPDFAGRELDVCIEGIFLTALHIADDAAPTLKAAHWNRTIELARLRRERNHLIIGDLNTARNTDTRSPLACSQRLGVLTSLGFRDLWTTSPIAERGDCSTWRAPWGEGRRIDAAWASASLAAARCEHVPCDTQDQTRTSDHCALLVDLQ